MNRVDVKPALRGLPLGMGGLALALCIIFLALRALAMFGPASMRALLPLTFIAMTLLPWLVLSPHGRYQIGLKFPASGAWFAAALGAGIAAAAACFVAGHVLYGASSGNWFVSVANVYRAHPTAGFSLLQLHLTFTIAACLFSPIGEELFFRGFLQKVLEQRVPRAAATHLEAALFALVHLCHHGIVATAAGLVLLPGSAGIWVMLMFCVAWLFAWLRQASDSLLPAIVAHAAFNATMNSFIFAFLWNVK